MVSHDNRQDDKKGNCDKYKAMDMLGCKESKLYRLAKKGVIKRGKVSGTYVIKSIEKYLEN